MSKVTPLSQAESARIAEAAKAKALALHDEAMNLISEASRMDEDFGHATLMIEMALEEHASTIVNEIDEWSAGVRKTDALLRGALSVGDVSDGQAVILRRCLSLLAALMALTNGVSFAVAGEALNQIARDEVNVCPAQIATRTTSTVTTTLDRPVNIEQADHLLSEIATLACTSRSLCYHSGEEAAVTVVQVLRDAMDRIGWMADLAMDHIGSSSQAIGSAEGWLLPPIYNLTAQKGGAV